MVVSGVCVSCFSLDDGNSSVQSFDRLGRWGDMSKNGSAEILYQSFMREAIMNSSGIGWDVHSSEVVHPAFSLPTTAPQTFKDALKDGFGKCVVARDMPEPC